MASKAAMSVPLFLAKLLRHQQTRLPAAPFASATRAISTGGNPFLRSGEVGACRVEKAENECYMRVDVPGVGEDDIRVWSEPGFIYFYGRDGKLPAYNYDGRFFGGSISFNPDQYDSAGIRSEVRNGVLWLVVPRLRKD
ncbi:14.7 kDa heat shock protein [Diospyros lotus]|uniref:14.7 kDa heat shock protein n=1 Tax=Diospyros lotus TaxID=55363 RepID=UPI00225AB14B|nr:14.7 kDa heat shock protein [Diospyros lotus]